MKPPDEKNQVPAPPAGETQQTPPATPPAAPPAAKTAQEVQTQAAQRAAKDYVADPPPKPAGEQQAAPPAKEEAPKETPPKAKEATLTGDEEQLPDAELYKLSPKALEKRLARASSAETKKLFESLGVKDADELKAKVAKAKAADEAAETARLAQLSKEEKLAEDLAKVTAERDGWKTKHEQTLTSQQMKETQGHYEKIAAEFLDPDYVEDELPRLGKFLVGKYDDKELADLPDDVVRAYFKARVAAKPKLGKDAAPPPPPEKKGLTTTAPATKGDERPAPPKAPAGPVSYKPKPGETPEERRAVAAEIRKNTGISF
jgi:hypothetical protein